MSKTRRRQAGPTAFFIVGTLMGLWATISWVAALTDVEGRGVNLGGAIILSGIAACFLIIGCIKVGTRGSDGSMR